MPPLAANLKITFEVRYRPPKGRDIRLYTVGTIPELGSCRIDDNKINKRLERNIQKAYRAQFLAEIKKQGSAAQSPTFGERDSDDSSGGEDAEIDPKEWTEMDRNDPSVPEWNKLEEKPILSKCLRELAVPLEEDPNDSGIADLWSSDPVPIYSLNPGQRFSYLYFAWDLDHNRLWDIERFQEARSIEIPPLAKPLRGQAQVNELVCRAVNLHQKGCTLKPVMPYEEESISVPDDDDSDGSVF
eukprot:Gregarina_sp_Poly_1__1850@NODE_1481_length_4034_cov_82_911016_g981_i0_p2_GENE_NODE_1481_length_4034_cov_82_911016_g981_i0NODE_1481_length_4034_cov_82_911016_g981_i0_p2_ORF_typecomplete_len243_score41_53CBM_20/PF00686_19/1CBM_20/PF00686_19/8_4_NODE_1481_length_4034_cov_82_911016_g981_i032123940